ncbi:RNA polymerase sigma factor [Actinomadura monticuli]|uniref:Sigma-70 family RNA polymerase sigma factor n=1 Tax=Actinomadura monticuli TaxID=3097367 RepID=A0ABV4QCQ6_9ACTN
MRGDLGSLYDAHADRLYAYCWSLVGDRLAAAAVGDTFNAAVHQPPRGDSVLWLYSLSRTACAERGAFTGELAAQGGMPFAGPDPLLRAAGGLRSDHREVLLLWAGEWLEPHDIARVLGIAPDTVGQLLAAARTRLERTVLDILMRGTAGPQPELITAFEKGRLPQLLARRAPDQAPGWLRDRVLAACAQEAARPLPSVAAPAPLVVIGAERKDRPKRGMSGGISRGLGAAAGVAASAAAVIGLLVSWPTAKGGGDAASMVPSASKGQTNPASAKTSGVPQNPLPGLTGPERAKGGGPAASENPVTGAFDDPPRQAGGAPAAPAPPASTPSRTPSPEKKPETDTPSRPEKPSTPPDESPTTPPETTPGDPATPPDDGSTPPATPPADTPTDPSDGSETPSPSPTANPAPEPGQG